MRVNKATEIIEEEKKEDEVTVEVKTKDKTASKKEVGTAGRKKVKDTQKKKARQVYYSDEVYENDIAKCAEHLGIEPKTFMEMAINQKVKATLKMIEQED